MIEIPGSLVPANVNKPQEPGIWLKAMLSEEEKPMPVEFHGGLEERGRRQRCGSGFSPPATGHIAT